MNPVSQNIMECTCNLWSCHFTQHESSPINPFQKKQKVSITHQIRQRDPTESISSVSLRKTNRRQIFNNYFSPQPSIMVASEQSKPEIQKQLKRNIKKSTTISRNLEQHHVYQTSKTNSKMKENSNEYGRQFRKTLPQRPTQEGRKLSQETFMKNANFGPLQTISIQKLNNLNIQQVSSENESSSHISIPIKNNLSQYVEADLYSKSMKLLTSRNI